MLIFKEITIADLAGIRRIVEQTGFRSCQLSAGGLYCLAIQYQTRICFDDSFLYVQQCRPDVGVCYFMPLGAGNLGNATGKLRAYHAGKYGAPLVLWGIADDMTPALQNAVGSPLTLTPDRNWAEYIHEARRLQTLQGRRMQPKRNAANQFRRNHPDFVYEPISAANIEEVWRFQQTHTQLDGKLDHTIRRGLDIFHEGGFAGGIIRIDGGIEGYAMGCPINATDFDILFENANKNHNGIFQTLEQELIARQLADYQYINREEDLGINGIRFAKTGLCPDVLLMKYTAVL